MSVLRPYFSSAMRNKLHWTITSETSNTKYLELIKRRSKVQEKNMSCEKVQEKNMSCEKVQEKNMSCERALNLDQ